MITNTIKKRKDVNYYSNKINNYLKLLNIELTKEEKEMVLKKLKSLEEKLNSMRDAEKLNIETIKKNEENILKDKTFNQYKSYLVNKNLYLDLKDKEIPDTFKFMYECYEYVNSKIKLTKTLSKEIEKITIDNMKVIDDFNLFIEYFNNHHNKETFFDFFLN